MQLFFSCALLLFSYFLGSVMAQGLVVEQGTTLSNNGSGYGIFGSPTGIHIALSNSEIQGKVAASPTSLFLNYRGGDLSLAHGDGTTSSVSIGSGTENRGLFNAYNTLYVDGDEDKVGIGTSIPNEKLDILDGSIRVTNGNLKLNSAAPNIFFSTADGTTPLASIGSLLSGLIIQNQATGTTADILMTTENGTLKLEDNGRLGVNKANPQADIHLLQSSNEQEIDAGIFFEDAEVEFAGEGWQIAHSGLHFSFVDKVEGDNTRRAYVEDNTGNYVQPPVPPLASNLGVKNLKNTLSKIKQLRPVLYQNKTKRSETSILGFSVMTVKNIFPELIHYGENGELGLAYSEFGVLAIQAIQEQQVLIEKAATEKAALAEKVVQLEEKVAAFAELQERLLALETNLQSCCLQHQGEQPFQQQHTIPHTPNSSQDRAQLQQNFPNPFHQQTAIQYYLPSTVSSAILFISDLNGKRLKSHDLSDNGVGQVMIDGMEFGAGIYIYTLIVDDKVVDTKQMVLTD